MDLHIALVGAIYICGAVLLSLLGLFLVRRLIPHHLLSPHNDVAGFVYATIAVTYAVILGFVTITVWEQFEAARSNADQEANAVADLYRLSEWLPEPGRSEIQIALIDYARSVIEDEWDAMDEGTAPSSDTDAALERIWDLYLAAGSETVADSAAYGDSLGRLQDLGNARRLRLLESDASIPGMLWAALIAGGVITVAFAYGFGVASGQSHAMMLATLAASISLLLFLISSLNRAFHGDVRVEPEGMHLLLRQFGQL